MPLLLTEIDQRGVACLSLNNPERHNVFDDCLIGELTAELQRLAGHSQVRVVVLTAIGKSFSAGADLNWMRRMADYTHSENLRDAMALADLLETLNTMPQPTLARVQGAAFGGGVGLVAACDIALASDRASFCLSEVKLGLIPAVISPYVLAAIGERQARRYMLTAERFTAAEALRIGLIHQLCAADELAQETERICRQLLQNGPQALRETKRLIRDVAGKPIDHPLRALTAERIASARASDEGRAGLSAFLHKQAPSWLKE